MDDDRSTPKSIKTTETVFDTIELLMQTDGATVTEIANRSGMAKSTIHAHLMSLTNQEFIVKDDNQYRLSLRFLELGIHVRNEVELVSVAKPLLSKLAEKTGEAIWLIVEEYGWAIYLDKAMGDNAVRIESNIGERAHLHYLAAGKALLAFRPHEEVESILDRRGLPRQTDATITDPETLFDELAEIRERGYAFNEDEEIEGVRGVGAPICEDDRAIGAIGIGAPKNRLRDERYQTEFPNLLRGATNEIELRHTYR